MLFWHQGEAQSYGTSQTTTYMYMRGWMGGGGGGGTEFGIQ